MAIAEVTMMGLPCSNALALPLAKGEWPVESAINDDRPIIKSVRFGSVELHTHKRILGDCPAVSRGLPVSLDWKAEDSEIFSVDDFENYVRKSSSNNNNKESTTTLISSSQRLPPRLTSEERFTLLCEAGHSRDSFQRVYREIVEIKRSQKKATAMASAHSDEEGEEQEVEEHSIIILAPPKKRRAFFSMRLLQRWTKNNR